MAIGIYKQKNKLNGNIYIGQSTNIYKRYQQHLYDAENRCEEKGTGIDFAIKKYGIDNFDFEIIEECSADKLDEREKYWIAYYDSYNNGYNRTIGGASLKGKDHPRATLTEEQVYQIRELYKNRVKRSDAWTMVKDWGLTERNFLKIWKNETWCHIHSDVYTPENKEWHKSQVGHSEDQLGLSSLDRTISQDEINEQLNDYSNGMSINAIAKKYHRDNGTIERYLANPVAKTKVKYRGRTLKNINTGEIFQSISAAARWAGCGATTLTRHLATDKIAGTVPETGEPAQWEELS